MQNPCLCCSHGTCLGCMFPGAKSLLGCDLCGQLVQVIVKIMAPCFNRHSLLQFPSGPGIAYSQYSMNSKLNWGIVVHSLRGGHTHTHTHTNTHACIQTFTDKAILRNQVNTSHRPARGWFKNNRHFHVKMDGSLMVAT